ncbi:MAG TPA: hypothetical protein VGR07_21115 [Thermoanaerobaculia bacterium]|jgi:hypothetical protein|nr:hypothetical protein [Thermoanaerobaculia bacterium]
MQARRCLLLAAALLVAVATPPAVAWTPATQATIAREAARLAPPDLARQIARHKADYQAGVAAPFADTDALRHMRNPDGEGSLDRVIAAEAEGAVAAIRGHQPFAEVVRRLGTVAHFVADADNPLAASGDDPEEGRYFADFLRYAESAEPRFPLIFYGAWPALNTPRDLDALLAESLRRGRELYPTVGREYRRIDFASGLGRFDDRSSAFGVASVAWSHAVTDVALVLRYIWLRAGGADDRSGLSTAGGRLLLIPRARH